MRITYYAIYFEFLALLLVRHTFLNFFGRIEL